jgi:hypothetical protein
MVEVNHRLSMDEKTSAKLPGFVAVRQRAATAVTALADATMAQ